MTKMGHFNVKQGKRVLAIMRDGNHLILKFKEHKGNWVEFYDHEPIKTADMRTLSIYKGV